jgi:hypothetical protein
MFPSISSPLDVVLFGGIVDPWIEKGPTIAVISAMYSYPVMDQLCILYPKKQYRNCNILKLYNMNCLVAQPSAFGSHCC